MPSLGVILSILRELVTSEHSPRVPEPSLVMDDRQQVEAYTEAGRENGVMAPVYIFNGANICEVIRAGDIVIDLACGPANQLAMVARLNPDVHFIGLDMSFPMLQQADELISRQGLNNVNLCCGDITELPFANDSIDVVLSTMALHHLPDVCALKRSYSEAARVLKPGGGIYMMDFGHLKSSRSIDYFAHQYADRQPAIFTLDYLNSLHAAFSAKDIRRAAHPLFGQARLYSTFLTPFMVVLKSPPRRSPDMALAAKFTLMKQSLPRWHQKDLADLKAFFKMGGLSCALLD